jgi:hypothetical protein
MAKKHYDLSLDSENMEALDRWLEAGGLTRSGYINTLIGETVKAMKLKEIPDYSKLSIVQLFGLVSGVGKMMKGKVK